MTMTTVLVAYASKMGSTKEIAEVIGVELARVGLDVQVRDACDVTTVHGYDAVVVGSAIYADKWRPDAVRVVGLIVDKTEDVGPSPTWLFHSGPCGAAAAASDVVAPKRVRQAAHQLGVAPPVTFGGRLEPATAKGFIARKMAKGKMAGDFRDFDRIREWAASIAAQLTAHPVDLAAPEALPKPQAVTVHTPSIFH
jgi:menaquinone-dependent protoporphyrinogen oxidase